MVSQQNKDELARLRRNCQLMLKRDLKGRDIMDPCILRVMAEIPREKFVPQVYFSQAYNDGPLPIGMGQTISQPYIVALMTQELQVNKKCTILEIGTGSGYQTAILCRLAKKVYTIEKFKELSESAQQILRDLGITNVEFYIGDGSCGWPESPALGEQKAGYFERIMITAAVPRIPETLIQQLADGGSIIAPVGGGGFQELVLGKKQAGKLTEISICGCRFVKLIGKYGFEQ
jgi:protein-L-isoaspartate(D-aspartate) O-methyltransferase